MRFEFIKKSTPTDQRHKLEIVDYEHCQNDIVEMYLHGFKLQPNDSHRASRKLAHTSIVKLITTRNLEIGLVFLHFNHDVMNISELCTCIW